MKTTNNLGLRKIELTDSPPDITVQDHNWDLIDKHINTAVKFSKATGTGTAITLSELTLEDGFQKTFIVTTNNNGTATKINGKNLYKPGGTIAPNLINGKAVTIWYDLTGDCFFIKASAEGDAGVADVLAGKKYSNDNDTGLTGTMPNNGSVGTKNLTTEGAEYTIPAGYHNGLGKVKAVITGIIASVIKAGTTVGGILGTFTSDANATAGDILSGKSGYVNGNKVNGNIVNRSTENAHQPAVGTTVSSANGYGAYMQPPAGYYNGTTWVRSLQPDLLAANIASGKSIFGVVGTAEIGGILKGTIIQTDTVSYSFRKNNDALGNARAIFIQKSILGGRIPKYIICVGNSNPPGAESTSYYTIYCPTGLITNRAGIKVVAIMGGDNASDGGSLTGYHQGYSITENIESENHYKLPAVNSITYEYTIIF